MRFYLRRVGFFKQFCDLPLVAVLILLMTACGGGGGNSSEPLATDTRIRLSWIPNLDPVDGYIVLAGSTPENITPVSALAVTSPGFDPQAPTVLYEAGADLGLALGDTVCFRLAAYYNGAISDLSAATCAGI